MWCKIYKGMRKAYTEEKIPSKNHILSARHEFNRYYVPKERNKRNVECTKALDASPSPTNKTKVI